MNAANNPFAPPPAQNSTAVKKGGGVKAAILVVLVPILIAAMLGGAYGLITYLENGNADHVATVLEYLKTGRLTDATDVFNKIGENETELVKLANLLTDRLQDIRKDYDDGRLDAAAARKEVATIRNFRIRSLNNLIDTITEHIDRTAGTATGGDQTNQPSSDVLGLEVVYIDFAKDRFGNDDLTALVFETVLTNEKSLLSIKRITGMTFSLFDINGEMMLTTPVEDLTGLDFRRNQTMDFDIFMPLPPDFDLALLAEIESWNFYLEYTAWFN
jgi:hypothetical protein